MHYSSQNIKLSFGRPRYETIGNTVKCSLNYTIKVPAIFADSEVTRGNNGESASSDVGIIFNFTGMSGEKITSTGTAQCHPNDSFDKSVGRKIARARAEQAAYSFARRLIGDYVEKAIGKLSLAIDMFDRKSSEIIEADKRFVTDLSESYIY